MKLRYSSSQATLHLLELPEDVDMHDLIIKSSSSDQPAVLCSRGKTYSLKNVLTSNSLLISKQISNDFSVSCQQDSYIECVEAAPNTENMLEMLGVYNGDVQVDNECTIEWMDRMIPVSLEQIKQNLREFNAFEIEGKLWVLDWTYAKYLIELMFACLISEGKDNQDFSLEFVHKILSIEVEQDSKTPLRIGVVQALLNLVASERKDTMGLYELDTAKIAKFLAEFLFKTEKESWILRDFMAKWALIAPSFVQVNVQMLQGLALVDEDDANEEKKVVKYIPKQRLLALAMGDIRKRFDLLFAIKKKWTQDEILAYVDDLGDSATLEAILLKYARVARATGATFYTNRFPVSKKMIEILENY